MSKVDITTGAHTVIVEGDDPVSELAGVALQLWRDTRDAVPDKPGPAFGFIAERADGWYGTDHEVTLATQAQARIAWIPRLDPGPLGAEIERALAS